MHHHINASEALVGMRVETLTFMRRLYAKRTGDVTLSTIMGRQFATPISVEAMRELFVDRAGDFRKHYGGYAALFGRPTLSEDGAAWRAKRAAAQACFRPGAEEALLYGAEPVFERLDARLAAASRTGEPIDLRACFAETFLDLVLSHLFGRAAPQSLERMAADLEAAVEALDVRALRFSALGKLASKLGRRRGFDALQRWRRMTRTLIDAPRVRTNASDGVARAPLMDALLASVDTPGAAFGSTEALADEASMYLAGGSRAMAAAACYAVSLIASHDLVRRDVADEALSAAEPGGPQSMDEFQVARRAVQEALRLRPPVWAVSRVAVRPTRIADIELRPGDVAFASFWGLHRSPRYWREPQVFSPSRFNRTEALKRSAFAYLPFGCGPRSCLASQVAMTQLVAMTVMVFGRYAVLLDDAAAIDENKLRAGFTLWPTEPVWARLAPLIVANTPQVEPQAPKAASRSERRSAPPERRGAA